MTVRERSAIQDCAVMLCPRLTQVLNEKAGKSPPPRPCRIFSKSKHRSHGYRLRSPENPGQTRAPYLLDPGHLDDPAHVRGVDLVLDEPAGQAVPLLGTSAIDGESWF